MFNPIPAHIQLIHCDYIFGEIIPNGIIYSKFPLYCTFICQQISYLDIKFFTSPVTDKVYFLFANFPDCYLISAAQKFQVHYIFKNQVNVPHVSPVHSFPDPMVCNIIFFIGRQNLLSL